MKAYVAVSGALFGLLAAVHVFRVCVEGFGPLHNPVFVIATALALALFVWAAALLISRKRSESA